MACNPNSVTAIPLTKEHYMVIGNSRGKISDTNPNGLSKQQMHTMKSLLIYESNNKIILIVIIIVIIILIIIIIIIIIICKDILNPGRTKYKYC